MVDQALHILSRPDTDNARLSSLKTLDSQLQSFSALLMSEYRVYGRHCGANATVIRYIYKHFAKPVMDGTPRLILTVSRTLFYLHQGILSQSRDARSETIDTQGHYSSCAALDTTARMMAAVAHDHVKHVANIDVLPICAAYNVKIAMEHIEARRDYIGQDSSAALESLEIMGKAFRDRWPAQEPHLYLTHALVC